MPDKPTPPEATVINVAHLAADKAIPESWEKGFDMLFPHLRDEIRENGEVVFSVDSRYAVKSFIRNLIKQQRSEVAREIDEKFSWGAMYKGNLIHKIITEEYLKENEE